MLKKVTDDIYGDENSCESFLEREQRAQIEDLQQQIHSLKSSLLQKENEIKKLQFDYARYIKFTDKKIEKLRKDSDLSYEQKVSLEHIHDIDDNFRRFESLLDFLDFKPKKVESSEVIERLRSQLQGHVDFLTRLATMPEFQHNFLISDISGSTFLKNSTKEILLEQCRRTTRLLYEVSNGTPNKLLFGDFADILFGKLNLEHRAERISKVLHDQPVDIEEIKGFFVQEAVITAILSKKIEKLDQRLYNIIKESNDAVTHAKKYNTVELERNTIDSLFNALNYENVLEKEHVNYNRLIQELCEDVIKAKKEIGDDIMISMYITKTNRTIQDLDKKLSQSHLLLEKQAEILQKRNNCDTNAEWESWARRLYAGLMGLNMNPNNVQDLRIAIEEAAITTLGNRTLQNRLNTLRFEKKIMSPPVTREINNHGFTPLIVIVMALSRMRRNAGAPINFRYK